MKKAERLNDMLLFLSDKSTFNLKDLMQRYGISRSSALRDIQALEELGMPLYAQPGRNGGYRLLPNRLLSTIVFTVDEMHALYFAMLTLRAYQSTPFHLCVESLQSKFEGCLSKNQTAAVHRMADILQLDTAPHPNTCPWLKDILQLAVAETPCVIAYQKRAVRQYTVQFFELSAAYGQWYGTAYNFETEKPQVFRCDKIISVQEAGQLQGKPLQDFDQPPEGLYRAADATAFTARLTEKGADVFYREHYPSVRLCTEEGRPCLKGFYHADEEAFIADYLIRYGDTVTALEPPKLKRLVAERLRALLQSYA